MKIGITADHHGVKLKEIIKKKLEKLGCTVTDYGTDSSAPVDYPDKAFRLGESIKNKKVDLGIAICKTGIGMSIALNKVKDVRCAKISNSEEVVLAKEHNNVNAIAIASELNPEIALNIVKKFIEIPFSEVERHIKRINKIDVYETRNKNEL